VQLHLPAAEAAVPTLAETAPALAQDIVLVEDDANIARVVGELLESLGHTVRHAPQALAALAEIATRRPQSVLLDLDLPGVSGLQLAGLLRAQEVDVAVARLRLVALTARSDATAERDAYAAGVDAFRRKPIPEDEILKSAVLNYPLTQYMFCAPDEGAAAVIMCRGDIAHKFTDKPVYVRATEIHPHVRRLRGACHIGATGRGRLPDRVRRPGRLRSSRHRPGGR
jgi:CheY-like chemotaxis protein